MWLSKLTHNDSMINLDLARSPKQIGNVIRNARRKRGWRQTQLGEKAGLRQETISLIETGNPATRTDTLLSVLAVLELEFRIAPQSRIGPRYHRGSVLMPRRKRHDDKEEPLGLSPRRGAVRIFAAAGGGAAINDPGRRPVDR